MLPDAARGSQMLPDADAASPDAARRCQMLPDAVPDAAR